MAGIEAVPEFLEAELIGHNIQVQLDVPEGVLNSRLGVGVSCGQTFGDLLDRLYTIAVERQRGGRGSHGCRSNVYSDRVGPRAVTDAIGTVEHPRSTVLTEAMPVRRQERSGSKSGTTASSATKRGNPDMVCSSSRNQSVRCIAGGRRWPESTRGLA